MSVPGPPNINIQPLASPNTLEYDWDPPTNPNGTILAYKLTVTDGPTTIYTNSSIPPTETYYYLGPPEITLTNGTTYSSYLQAINENGEGAQARFLDFIPGDPPDIAPSTLSVSVINPTSAAVMWTPPSNAASLNAPIQWYTIYATSQLSTFSYTADGSTSNYFINNLVGNANNYTYSINAVNCPGYSPPRSIILSNNNILGTAEWATFLDGTGSDSYYSIATDSSNNLYVCGNYSTSSTITLRNASGNGQSLSSVTLPSTVNTAICLVKYDSSGIVQWATYFDGNAAFTENAYSVRIDSSGNILLAGSYRSSLVVTLKDANGNTQVNSAVTLPITTSDAAFLVKYNSNGIVQWATNFDSSTADIGYSIAVDRLNNVYITGQYASASVVTVKNVSGNSQTNSSITLPDTSSVINAFLIKYNSDGQAQWATLLRTASTSYALGIEVDSQNNIYIVGQYTASATITLRDASGNGQVASTKTLTAAANIGAFLIKYNTNGVVQWSVNYTSSNACQAYAITIDSSDNVYIAGTYIGTPILRQALGNGQGSTGFSLPAITTTPSCFIKYNSSGTMLWVTYLGSTTSSNAYGITKDSANNIYVTGRYSSSSIFVQNVNGLSQSNSTITLPSTSSVINGYLIKYNSSGQAQWALNIVGTGTTQGRGIAVDSRNFLYIGGDFTSTAALTVRNASGNTQVNSSITIPAPTSAGAFLIKYS
jgi:hypothetical protein